MIGNDDYTNGWPKLSNAVKDAEEIAAVLEAKGFDVELHRNLTSDELNTVFKKFFILKGDNPGARLFIWFAGHGATVEGEGYLIPTDAPVPSVGAAFKFTSIALRDFGTYMRQAVSKHVYAVFDSCFAGTVFAAQRALPPAAITRATTMPVRQFLTSGDADQTVSDDGTFRELFIRAINGEERSDANGDGYVTASELGMFLGDRVTNLTQSVQTPRFGKLRDKDFDRGDFVFMLPGGPSTAASGARAPAANSAELVFWESVKNSDNASEFDAYLKQYPKGSFSTLAMVKKKQLEAKIRQSTQPVSPRKGFEIAFANEFMRADRVANIRRTPFPTADRVGRLEAGDRVWVIGRTETPGGVWYNVARDGASIGFIYAPLLASATSADQFIAIKPLPLPALPGPEAVQEAESESSEQKVAEAETAEPADPDSADADVRLSFLVEDLLEDVTATPVTSAAAPAGQQTLASASNPAVTDSPSRPSASDYKLSQPESMADKAAAYNVAAYSDSTSVPEAAPATMRGLPAETSAAAGNQTVQAPEISAATDSATEAELTSVSTVATPVISMASMPQTQPALANDDQPEVRTESSSTNPDTAFLQPATGQGGGQMSAEMLAQVVSQVSEQNSLTADQSAALSTALAGLGAQVTSVQEVQAPPTGTGSESAMIQSEPAPVTAPEQSVTGQSVTAQRVSSAEPAQTDSSQERASQAVTNAVAEQRSSQTAAASQN
ncbi:MAG: caspase family protein, partial [Candidatus Competibacteraceae bacterium]|nr:caspase family protein [Candidatus Competibacteraceae bacterium]